MPTISQDPKETAGASTTSKEHAGVLTISQDPQETATTPEETATTPEEPAGKIVNLTFLKQL